jgi:hypothetical protein
MKTILLVAALSAVTGCANKPLITWSDRLDGAFEVGIEEDAPIRSVCLQWFVYRPDAGAPDWIWRCVTVDDLRRLAFPESAK